MNRAGVDRLTASGAEVRFGDPYIPAMGEADLEHARFVFDTENHMRNLDVHGAVL